MKIMVKLDWWAGSVTNLDSHIDLDEVFMMIQDCPELVVTKLVRPIHSFIEAKIFMAKLDCRPICSWAEY